MALTLAQAITGRVEAQQGDKDDIWADLGKMGLRLHHAPHAFFEVVGVIGVAQVKRQAITGLPLGRRTRQAQAGALGGQGPHRGARIDFGLERYIARDNGVICARKNFGSRLDKCLARMGLFGMGLRPSRDQGRSKFRFDFNHGRQTYQKADKSEKGWWIRKDRGKVTRPRATWITRWVPDDRNHGSNQRQLPTSELGRRDVDFPREPQNHQMLRYA